MQSSAKKRKHSFTDKESKSRKKQAVSFANDAITVSHIGSADELPPVLAVPVGLSAPQVSFKAYSRKTARIPKASREILLQSSEHARLDYLGGEDFGSGSDALLDHYVGVYDPTGGDLKLVPVRRVAMRSTLRLSAEEVAEKAAAQAYQTLGEKRRTLGMEFGNKKAKKRIMTQAENAVITAGDTGVLSASSKALLESIGESVAQMPTAEEMAESVESAKPKPKANPNAKHIDEVYPIETLIGNDLLERINIDDWLEKAMNKEIINTTSKYVSRRLGSAAAQGLQGNVVKPKVLMYIYIMIRIFQKLKPIRDGMRLPNIQVLLQLDAPKPLIDSIRKRFVKGTGPEMSNWEVDNLITHVCAMTLFIDGHNTELADLCEDLRVEQVKMRSYFEELGCKVGAPNAKEKAAQKMTAAEAKGRKVARLTCPPTFPPEKKRGGYGRR